MRNIFLDSSSKATTSNAGQHSWMNSTSSWRIRQHQAKVYRSYNRHSVLRRIPHTPQKVSITMNRPFQIKLSIALVAAFSLMTALHTAAQTPAARPPALAATFKDDFLIGTAIDFTANNPLTPEELEIIKHQFNQITPENSTTCARRSTGHFRRAVLSRSGWR